MINSIRNYLYNKDREKRVHLRKKALADLGMQLEKPGKKIELLAKGQGMYVGGYFNPETKEVEALMDNDVTHVLVVAPTRAGKGVGIVMPTMLTWTGSTVVHDTKPELWPMTSGWRKAMGHTVLKFDPATGDGSSVKYNPFEEVRWYTPFEVSEIQNLAEMLMNPTGKGAEGDNAHWVNSATDLTTGAIIHLWYSPQVPKAEKNLAGLLKFLSLMMLGASEDEDPALAAFQQMSEERHATDAEDYYWMTDVVGNRLYTHPQVREMCGRMIAKGDKERGSVISSALANLKLYADPIVADNTRYSEFRLSQLMNHDTPVDLYLVVRDPDIDRLKPLTRLVVTQIISYIMSDMRPFKHRCLFMLDEFASLGKLDKIPIALTKIAGYGVKFCIILQTTDSLKAAYGNEKAGEVLANCHTRIMFSPNDLQTAKEISEICGKKKVLSVETSASGKRMGAFLDSTSVSQREEYVDLITAAEALQMHSDEIIVMRQGQKPIRGRKFYFYKIDEFRRRAASDKGDGKFPMPAASDRLLQVDPAALAAKRSPEEAPAPPQMAPEERPKPMSLAEFIASAKAQAERESEGSVAFIDLDDVATLDEDDMDSPAEAEPTEDEAQALNQFFASVGDGTPAKGAVPAKEVLSPGVSSPAEELPLSEATPRPRRTRERPLPSVAPRRKAADNAPPADAPAAGSGDKSEWEDFF